MLGAFNYDQDLESRDVNFRFPTGWKDPVDVIDIMNTSLFGLVEWRFLDAWSLTVEGRYMEETKAGYNFCTAASATCTRPDNDFANGPGQQLVFSGKKTWYSFTPRATIKWDVTPDLSVYAIYAEGVKPGGFNRSGGVTTGQTTFDPETSENYELGLKSMWLDGRLMVNAQPATGGAAHAPRSIPRRDYGRDSHASPDERAALPPQSVPSPMVPVEPAARTVPWPIEQPLLRFPSTFGQTTVSSALPTTAVPARAIRCIKLIGSSLNRRDICPSPHLFAPPNHIWCRTVCCLLLPDTRVNDFLGLLMDNRLLKSDWREEGRPF